MPLTDEYQTDPITWNGSEYLCLEHARWAALWTSLGFEWKYRPREIRFYKPSPGQYKPLPTEVLYAPPFFVKDLEMYMDVRNGWPRHETLEKVGRLAHLSGVHVMLFRGPLFVPSRDEYPWSVPGKIVRGRSEITLKDVFLMDDDRRIYLGHDENPDLMLTLRLVDAFKAAVKVKSKSVKRDAFAPVGGGIFCVMSGR